MIRRKLLLAGTLVLGATSGCGLTEAEQVDLAYPTATTCPEQNPDVSARTAAERAELVVVARPVESYFVDVCHRAFLLEVDAVWKGAPPEVVLAIVQVDPLAFGDTWSELHGTESAVLLLERHPELPEAFRPVGESAGVVDVTGEYALPCQLPGLCRRSPLELEELRAHLGL